MLRNGLSFQTGTAESPWLPYLLIFHSGICIPEWSVNACQCSMCTLYDTIFVLCTWYRWLFMKKLNSNVKIFLNLIYISNHRANSATVSKICRTTKSKLNVAEWSVIMMLLLLQNITHILVILYVGGKTSGIFGEPEAPAQQQRPKPPGGPSSNIFGAAESAPAQSQSRSHPNKPKVGHAPTFCIPTWLRLYFIVYVSTQKSQKSTSYLISSWKIWSSHQLCHTPYVSISLSHGSIVFVQQQYIAEAIATISAVTQHLFIYH